MVDAAKAFVKEPPLRPLIDLYAVVEDFQWRYVDRAKTDQVIKYCAEAPYFMTAVQRAVEARDENGKHHNHQSKVDITARRLLGRRIVARRVEIGRINRYHSDAQFDSLHDLIDRIKPYGIGPVTVYDVAVRIGAYLGIEPRSVYMHAGVRQGMKSLAEHMHHRPWGNEPWRHSRLPVTLFPPPLNAKKADDVEDILCTYRGVFETW